MDPNYFVCTLGEAAQRADAPLDLENINQFMVRQADSVPQLPAVSFPYVNESEGAGHVSPSMPGVSCFSLVSRMFGGRFTPRYNSREALKRVRLLRP